MFELNRDRIEALAKNLEQTFMLFTKELAKELAVKEVREMRFNITASGVTIGSVRIDFEVAKSMYGSGSVSGNGLMAVCDEFARRNGWEQVHQPLMLEFDGSGDLKSEDHGVYVLERPSRSDPGSISDQITDDLIDELKDELPD